MQEKVLIAGGTGLIGSRLSILLEEKGYQVIHLSRREKKEARFPAYAWDLNAQTISSQALEGVQYIINLAGADAGKRWTARHKDAIIQSRVKSNQLLLNTIKEKQLPIKAYLAASAMGYYGNRGEEIMDEQASPGEGFLSYSTQKWEKAIQESKVPGIRTVLLRIGLVLSTSGGVLTKLLIPFNFLVGVYFGNGKQWYSWIHIDDVCRMFIYALEQEKMEGIYNAVGKNLERNKTLTRKVGEALKRPFLLLPAPVFMLKLALGELSQAVLTSTRVSSEKIQQEGFQFNFEDLSEALADLFKRKI